MILQEKIVVRISNQGRYYQALGYGILKQGQLVSVRVEDVPKTSINYKVFCACDNCGEFFMRDIANLHKRKSQNCYGCSIKIKNSSKNTKNISASNRRRVGELHPRWNPNKKEFVKYSNRVRFLTEQVYQKFKSEINPNDLKRTVCGVPNGYQLDHIISVKFGFDNNLSPEEISKKDNLQMLSWKENRDKHTGERIK